MPDCKGVNVELVINIVAFDFLLYWCRLPLEIRTPRLDVHHSVIILVSNSATVPMRKQHYNRIGKHEFSAF